MRLHGATQISAQSPVLPVTCPATAVVGRAVYVTGDKVGERYQVAPVDINDPATFLAIGVLLKKTASTEGVVQLAGLFQGLSGLTPGQPVYISASGALTHTAPTPPPAGIRLVQIIGRALSTTELWIDVKSPIILVA